MTTEPTPPRTDGRRRHHPTEYGSRPWQAMLVFALDRADRFTCALPYRILRHGFFDAPLPGLLAPFGDDVVDRHASVIRWGVLREEATEFVTFRLSPGLRRALRGVRRLEEWTWDHGRPEDPSLAIGATPLLETESADGRITLFATPAEIETLAASGVRLVEPLGVRAEPWPTP